jgi:nitrate/TMAO reductase-like tetraheme cytochrome c subunit
MKVPSFLTKATVVIFIVGGIAGLVAALAAEQIDHMTSTDAFCTSCRNHQRPEPCVR